MILKHIQKSLQNLYQLDCEYSVEDFILNEEQSESYKEKLPWIAQSDEVLFVQQEEDNVDIGLFINSNLLKKFDPLSLNETQPQHLPQLAPLMEGVSHFVYLMWKSEREHPVTQLELELQAEVDKFILGNLLWKEKSSAEKLMQHFFEDVKWNKNLSDEEKERYQNANHFASKYCSRLRDFFKSEKSLEDLCKEIRPFYRMGQADKLHYIRAL